MMTTERPAYIPEPTLRRLPTYHHLLVALAEEGMEAISCSVIGRPISGSSTPASAAWTCSTVGTVRAPSFAAGSRRSPSGPAWP